PMQAVRFEGDANPDDLAVRPDDDAVEMVGDKGERQGLLLRLGGLAGQRILAQEALGIEFAAADADIETRTEKTDDDIVESGLAQDDLPEVEPDQLAFGVEAAAATAGEIAGLEAEVGDGDRLATAQAEPQARATRPAGWFLPFGEIDGRGRL